MKYAIEMGSDAMVYIPCFIKIGSGIQKLIEGDTDTQTAPRSRKLILFFKNKKIKLILSILQNKERRLKTCL
jgi:hypothetical protein